MNYISNGVGRGLFPPSNHNKSTVTNNYIFILYRRGELCSPVLIRCELAGDRRSPLRVSSNENARRIKPSSDEEGGTP